MRSGSSIWGNTKSGGGTARAGAGTSCTYHGWALCPLRFEDGKSFPFDEPKDMVRIGRMVAHRQMSSRKKGTPSKIGISAAGCQVHAKSGKIKVPLLNISHSTMLSPWISMVVSKTNNVVVIMALAHDQHGEVGVGCDVVKLGAKSGANQLAELAAQFSASLMDPAKLDLPGSTERRGKSTEGRGKREFTLQPVRTAVPDLPPRNKNRAEVQGNGRPRRRHSNNRRSAGATGRDRRSTTTTTATAPAQRNAWADSGGGDSPAYEAAPCTNDGGYIDINHSNNSGYVDIDFGDCDAHYMSVVPVPTPGDYTVGDDGYMAVPPMYNRESSCNSLASFSEAAAVR